MLEDLASDCASYLKLDVCSDFRTVQDVIDNMLTRLDELTTVLQMIKLKNSDCSGASSKDICKYRSEITALNKKLSTIADLIKLLHHDVNSMEKQVEKAEVYFGIKNENMIKNLLWSFWKKRKENSCTSSTDEVPTQERSAGGIVSDYFQANAAE